MFYIYIIIKKNNLSQWKNSQKIIDRMKASAEALENLANEYRIALNAHDKDFPKSIATKNQKVLRNAINENYEDYNRQSNDLRQRANFLESFYK